MPESPPATAAAPASGTTFGPLRVPVFRMLWFTWLTANTIMWMNDVAAAWLMTSLGSSPLWVALVQSASTLPVLLLGLPSGAFADTLDRRRYFMATQLWVAATAIILCLVIMLGVMTPALLLALTFANGIGLAMRWPVFSAIIPEIVPRQHLPQALALNGVAMNASRIIGPLIAGALIASAGSEWVFVLNAVLSIGAAVIIHRWRREHKESPLGREKLASAMRVGVQFVWQSGRMRAILVRVSVFFLHSTAIMALMPLIAKGLPGGSAGTFTVMLAAMGVGSIIAALAMPRIRNLLPLQQRIVVGSGVQAAAAILAVFAPSIYIAAAAMAISGAAWITVANSLTVAAQMGLPDWVRARGMSIYQMALMGSTALGAGVWGQVATWTSIRESVCIAAASGVLLMLLAQRTRIDRATEEAMTPSRVLKVPEMQAPPRSGRIQVNIEYLVDPDDAAEFVKLMEESRRSRMRQGALSWQLLHDLYEPGRYIEQITDESWTEHLRRFDRVTAEDVALRDRKLAYHIPDDPPQVTRFLIEQD